MPKLPSVQAQPTLTTHIFPRWIRNAAPSIAAAIPAASFLAVEGVVHLREFGEGVLSGDPGKLSAAVLGLTAINLGSLAYRYRTSTQRQEAMLRQHAKTTASSL